MSNIEREEDVIKLEASSNQMVTFSLGKESFGLTTEYLQEIIRLPKITKVPNVQQSVAGVGNLRGTILPFIYLRDRLGMLETVPTKLTRILVLNFSNSLVGLIVDSVSEVISFDNESLSPPPEGLNSIKSQFLKGVMEIKEKERERLILVLDEGEILPEVDMKEIKQKVEEKINESLPDSQQVIALKVDSEEYAIDINKIKEIIRFREMTPVPNSPDYVLGLISIRGNLLPIMDLRSVFTNSSNRDDLSENPSSGDEISEDTNDNKKIIDLRRIVIVDISGRSLGFLVDSVSRVLRIENKDIAPPPSLITKSNGNNLAGVAKLEEGKRIVMILETENLVDMSAVSELGKKNEDVADIIPVKDLKDKNISDIQLVCFKVKDEEYAVNIMKVQEIIRFNEITNVPHSKSYMRGIINLRGVITPIIDMRLRFNYKENDKSTHTRIVVIQIEEKPVGLIVDSVTEVLRTSESIFEEIPSSIESNDDSFIERIGKLNEGKRIVALIDEDKIISDELDESLKSHTNFESESEMSQAS